MVSKGQAALEFLVTYGWAFLVILIMMAGLSYFGVLNPKSLLPEKCYLSQGLTCSEQTLTSGGTFQFYWANTLGTDMYLQGAGMTEVTGLSTAPAACGTNATIQVIINGVVVGNILNTRVQPGDVVDFRFGSCTSLANEQMKAKIYIDYLVPGKNFPRRAEGEVITKR